MDDLIFKTKKKPVTYGKATRKPGHGRPVDLDSEDELASMDTQISGRVSKVYTRQPPQGSYAAYCKVSKLT